MIWLYKLDKKGQTRKWRAYIVEDPVRIIIEHGMDKLQTKERVVKGKTRTTPLEQAKRDLESLYQKQRDDDYVEDIADYKEPMRPMLAQKYKSFKGEAYASPKMDGIRCFIMTDDKGNLSYISRTGKPFKDFKHISDELRSLVEPNTILDGELYSDSLPFNEISSYVNTEAYEDRDVAIKFYCYDFINLNNRDMPFSERLTHIPDGANIKRVAQHKVSSEDSMMVLFTQWVSEGYEGLMLKTDDPYVFGQRSKTLQKVKEMQTDEFLILDVEPSDNDPMKPKVKLQAANGDTFYTGTIKGDKDMVFNTYLQGKEMVIGKWMTVQYQTLSSYGIPTFPVGLYIREGKVIDGKFVPSV